MFLCPYVKNWNNLLTSEHEHLESGNRFEWGDDALPDLP